jgi:putative copper resistance protein D
VEPFAVAVRWVLFAGSAGIAGAFACVLLVARPAAAAAGPEALSAFDALDGRLLRLARWLVVVTALAGLLDLWRQVAVAGDLGLAASVAWGPVTRVLGETQYGVVWLARHGALLLLLALLGLAERAQGRADWLALRLEGLALGAVSLGALAAAGHAAATPTRPVVALAADAVHLLATGTWLGALVPLAFALRWARGLPGPAALAVAGHAASRFSRLGVASVSALVATGIYNTATQVGGFAPLFATPYGRWLLLKLALLLPLLGIAAGNLLDLVPRLGRAVAGQAAARPGDPGRLLRRVTAEAAIGAMILAVVAVLGLTTPAAHATPSWPFAFRFSWEATRALAGVQTRVAIGSQVALFGLVAALLAVIVQRRHWRRVLVAGVGAILVGLAVALPPIAIDAYPTTYLPPSVPYTATSVASGVGLYRTRCQACHGPLGYGDGPAAAGLPRRPADLTAKHTGDHTAGDLFWWLTHGIAGAGMPGFGNLSEEERWDLVNFLRALAAGEAARGLGPTADPEPRIAAPDFAYTTGVGEGASLRDYRGRGPVLLVLFTLPASRERLVALGETYAQIRLRGGQLIAIPQGDASRVYRELGGAPVFFPIAVDGAEDAVATYGLFGRDATGEPALGEAPPHMELLVDRWGYLRARYIPGKDPGWRDTARLLAEIDALAREAPRAAPPAEHVH